MALAHEKLYRSPAMARIEFDQYLEELVIHLQNVHQVDPNLVHVRMDLEPISLNITTAIPCGLVANELLMNVFTHAFPPGRLGVLDIRFRRLEDGRIELMVRDDGVGIPPEIDFRTSESLGLQIITLLTSQIDGAIDVVHGAGTEFRITFEEKKAKTRLV